MNETTWPDNVHDAYHAHVYFDAATIDSARQLCHNAGESFEITIGRFHEKPVGPHPMWSCQLAFERGVYDQIIPWLAHNRQELTVFIHAITGDDVKDHTDYTCWLGTPVELNMAALLK